ncbi:hypothetical protein N9N67_10050 [Bacteriovoracaceae bacterium]|nr:hypothetical protein [Bacteriovoracaceae bacterium]
MKTLFSGRILPYQRKKGLKLIEEFFHPKIVKGNGEVQIIGPMPFNKKPPFNLNRPTILVDGGENHNLKLSSRLFSIGDGDSLASNNPAILDFKLNPDKDISDLKAAYEKIQRDHKNFSQFLLLGFSGGDFAHQLCLFLDSLKFLTYATSPQYIQLLSCGSLEQRVIMLSQNYDSPWNVHLKGEFSLINLLPTSSKHVIKIQGKVKYSGQYPLECLSGSQGLHNRATGSFEIENTFPVMLVLGPEIS